MADGGARAPDPPRALGITQAAVVAVGTKLTVRQKIVCVAAALCEEAVGSAHISDVILACHRAFPENFGMRDRPAWPSDNRVLSKLCGPEGVGPAGFGWLVVTPEGAATVTRAGLRMVRAELLSQPKRTERAPRRRPASAAPVPSNPPEVQPPPPVEAAPAPPPRALPPALRFRSPAPWPLSGNARY